MKVVIAPQAFKGTLTGMEAARAMEEAVNKVYPGATTVLIPVADGGDGTVGALIEASGGQFITTRVTGPLGIPHDALWGVMGDERTAVIEMARASGLVLVPPERRDPRITTTLGTGELIREALKRGYRRIICGVGGSATNDGGAGMAQALGARLLDRNGKELPFGGDTLKYVNSIDVSGMMPEIKQAEVIIASDVTNPLCGPTGASAIYGPQKGATPKMVKELDAALMHYASIVKRDLGKDLAERPGAGAAGGLGYGLMVFLNAEFRPGIDLVCDVLGIDAKLKGADLVIVGEGMIDRSTVFNKAPIGVARHAKALGNPKVVAVAGSLGGGYEAVLDKGIDYAIGMVRGKVTLEEAMKNAYAVLRGATEEALKSVKL
jgi:glycerate kinase